MTNTRYIGPVDHIAQIDRLQAHAGFKVVMITTPDEHGQIKLMGPHHYEAPYSFSADSNCSFKKHSHGFESCTCGFYSYKHAKDALKHWQNECGAFANQAIVRVALSQKVVVCENGFRSTHQRVTRISMPPCWNCNINAGVFMVPHSAGFFVAGCSSCVGENPALLQDSYTFAEFSEKFSPSGYSRMEVNSFAREITQAETPDKTVKAALKLWGNKVSRFLEPDYTFKEIEPWIRQALKDKDLPTLKQILSITQSSIDALMAEGNNFREEQTTSND